MRPARSAPLLEGLERDLHEPCRRVLLINSPEGSIWRSEESAQRLAQQPLQLRPRQLRFRDVLEEPNVLPRFGPPQLLRKSPSDVHRNLIPKDFGYHAVVDRCSLQDKHGQVTRPHPSNLGTPPILCSPDIRRPRADNRSDTLREGRISGDNRCCATQRLARQRGR